MIYKAPKSQKESGRINLNVVVLVNSHPDSSHYGSCLSLCLSMFYLWFSLLENDKAQEN